MWGRFGLFGAELFAIFQGADAHFFAEIAGDMLITGIAQVQSDVGNGDVGFDKRLGNLLDPGGAISLLMEWDKIFLKRLSRVRRASGI